MESPEAAAERLHGALFGKNRDETVIDIIVNNNLEERLKIAKAYGQAYKNPLYEDMKSKLSGHFKELAGYLFLTPMEYYAKMLKRGFKGLSVDETLIFEVLCCHTPEEYEQLKEAYKVETNKELTKDIDKNFSGAIKKDLLNIISIPRRVNENPDKAFCEELADRLINAKEGNWVKDENLFKDVFIECSVHELVLVCRYYCAKTGSNIVDVIEKKCSGKDKTLLREILYGTVIPHELWAEKIRVSIKGLGTNTALLNRVLACRTNVDMPEIKEIYPYKYNITLREDILGDTSGVYQKLCLYCAQC